MPLSKQEIVNLALTQAGQPPLIDVDAPKSVDQRNALLFYRHRYEQLLSKFPWPFVCKRTTLTPLSGETLKFTYKYEIPNDVKFIWNIYFDKRDYINYPTSWDFGNVPVEVFGATFRSSDSYESTAEIIGETIETDHTQAYIYYTTTDDIAVTKAQQQFVDILMREVRLDIMKNKNTETERLGQEIMVVERANARDKKRQSIENRGSSKLPRSEILNSLDNW